MIRKARYLSKRTESPKESEERRIYMKSFRCFLESGVNRYCWFMARPVKFMVGVPRVLHIYSEASGRRMP